MSGAFYGVYGFDPVPVERLGPSFCPRCLATVDEQAARVQSTGLQDYWAQAGRLTRDEVRKLRCRDGFCIEGAGWVVDEGGVAMTPRYPVWDNLLENPII